MADLAGALPQPVGTIWYDNCPPQIPDANILPAQETVPSMLVALSSGAATSSSPTVPPARRPWLLIRFTLLDFGGGDNDFRSER